MKKLIRILALLLTPCLLLGGCGTEQAAQQTTEPTEKAQDITEPTEETMAAEAPAEARRDDTFYAAMAIADITPKKGVFLEGYAGKSELTLSTPDRFTSDLRARILLVQNAEDCLVFLNMEQLLSDSGYQYDYMSASCIERIAQICGTKKENVLLSNTHTHQASLTLGEEIEENILRAVEQAYQNLAPATIGTQVISTDYGISRSPNYSMNPDKPYDSRMAVVRFDNAQTGAPIGLVYSVPIHNTMLSNAPDGKTRYNLLNCEFTGYASRALEAQYGTEENPFVAMHINGFYGNSGPYVQGRFNAETVEELQGFGEEFAREIAGAYESIAPTITIGEIKAMVMESALPTNREDRNFAQYYPNKEQLPLYMSVGAFGDIAFIGVNYEPFSIIGARLKAEAPYAVVMPAACVNGWRGYIPTKGDI